VKEGAIAYYPATVSGKSGVVAWVWRHEDRVSEIGNVLRGIAGEGAVDDFLSNLEIVIQIEVEKHEVAFWVIHVRRNSIGHDVLL
jgi:hypothetical protein